MANKEVTVKIVANVDSEDVESLEQMINEIANDTVVINADTSEIDNLTEDIENLESIIEEEKAYGFDTTESEQELEDLKSKLEELKSQAENPTPVMFDTTDAEDSLNGLQTSIDGLSMMAVGEVLNQYGSGAEDLAQQMNTASISVGQLATQTGMAEPQMVSLINHISNATFPNNEAMMYVKSLDQMGVSAENLGASATNLDKINDAFGLGAEKTNSLGQELGVLGVDMNNVSSAFNSLAYANANTVGGMDNYFNFLRRYDADLKELGYNADQTAIIIAGATQKYGGGRAALTGLSEALKESNGDTRALEQALGLQAGALDNATQITGEYEGQLQQLADEEAEHKTIVDQLGAAWEDLSLSLSGSFEPFMSLFGLGGQVAGFGMQLNGTWELLSKFRNIGFISNLGGTVSGALSSLGGAFSSLWGILMANPIILIVVAIAALILGLIWAYNNVEWFRDGVNNLLSGLQWLASVIWDNLIGALDWLGQVFSNTGQIMYDAIIGAVNWIIDALQNLWNYIITLGGLLPSNVSITGNSIIDTILRVLGFLLTLPFQIGAIFINIIAKTLGFGDNFVQSLWQSAMDAVNNFASAINGIPQALKNCLDWAYQIIMSNPIVQALKWLGEQATYAFSVLGLKQHSPGDIFKAMKQELTWTKEAILDSDIAKQAELLGKNIVTKFGNPNLDYNVNGTMNEDINKIITATSKGQGDIIFNLYGDMDSDERMNRFVDAVIDRLDFENTTAGRTV